MYLADITIKKYLQDGRIEITPAVKDEDIRPAGVRIHLAKKILIPKPGHVDLVSPTKLDYETVDIEEDEFVLKPNAFVLASTIEKIKTAPNIIAFLDGRSTIARLGVAIHITAGVIDGNHDDARTITLEIKNLGAHSIRFHENDSLGQLMFTTLSDNIQQQSQSQYVRQVDEVFLFDILSLINIFYLNFISPINIPLISSSSMSAVIRFSFGTFK